MSPFLLTKLVDKRFKVFDEDDAGKDEGVRGVGDYEVPVERQPPIHQLASKKRWMADEMEERRNDDDCHVDDDGGGGGDVDDDDGGQDGGEER